MSVSLTTAQVIYAAQSKILELADIVAESSSFRRVKNDIKIGEALIRYIRVLQTDSTLTFDEQVAICQHMITIGNLYDFPASPTITSNEIFNFSANAEVGPQGPQGEPGQDGGGTDYNQFALTVDTTVDSFDVTDADGAEWSYRVKDGSNLRAGRVGAVWLSDGSDIEFYQYSTADIGSTSPITFDVDYSAGLIRLRAIITSGSWDVSGTRYFIPNNGAGVTVGSSALATGNIFIGSATNEAVAQAVSGDITLNSAGVAAIAAGVITNGDVSASAAITLSKLAGLTADRVLISSAIGVITTSTITPTKLNFLTDVTSNLQAQLDSKIGSVTGAISTVVSSNLSPNKVVISNASGKLDASGVSDTTLGYISTLSSNAQTQLNSKLNLSGGTLTGSLVLSANLNVVLSGTGIVSGASGMYIGDASGYGAFPGGISTQNPYGSYWKIKILDIGTWNMDTTPSKSISHGISSGLTKIIAVKASIYNDSATSTTDFVSSPTSSAAGDTSLSWNNTDVLLEVNLGSSSFANTAYDSTASTRGRLLIIYEA